MRKFSFLDYKFTNTAYGYRETLLKYCGLKIDPLFIDGIWMHGWNFLEYKNNVKMLCGSNKFNKNNKNQKLYVANEKQWRIFKNKGYLNVTVTGLPIIYFRNEKKIRRKNKSLLIMPQHSMPSYKRKYDEKNYLNKINKIKKNFNEVSICISRNCYNLGNWKKLIKVCDKVYIGAHYNDSLSFKKISYLMQKYEYVTSNILGSHILYAAFYGAKASVYGDHILEKEIRKNQFYKLNPELLYYVSSKFYKKLKEKYRFFFVSPHKAKNYQQWASKEIGYDRKKTKKEILILAGWNNFFFKQVKFLFNLSKIIIKKFFLIKNNKILMKNR